MDWGGIDYCLRKPISAILGTKQRGESYCRIRGLSGTSYCSLCQLEMFSDPEKVAKAEALDKTIEELRNRFGKKIIRNACLLDNPKMSAQGNPHIIMPTGVPQ